MTLGFAASAVVRSRPASPTRRGAAPCHRRRHIGAARARRVVLVANLEDNFSSYNQNQSWGTSAQELDEVEQSRHYAAEEGMEMFVLPGSRIGLASSDSKQNACELLARALSRKCLAGMLADIELCCSSSKVMTVAKSLDLGVLKSPPSGPLDVTFVAPLQVDAMLNMSLDFSVDASPSSALTQLQILRAAKSRVALVSESGLRQAASGLDTFSVLIDNDSSAYIARAVSEEIFGEEQCALSRKHVSVNVRSVHQTKTNRSAERSQESRAAILDVHCLHGAVLSPRIVYSLAMRLRKIPGVIALSLVPVDDACGAQDVVVGAPDVVYTKTARRWRYASDEAVNMKLSEDERERRAKLEQVAAWEFTVLHDGGADEHNSEQHVLKREFRFASRAAAGEFVQRVLQLSADLGSWPELCVTPIADDPLDEFAVQPVLVSEREERRRGRYTPTRVGVLVTLSTPQFAGVTDKDITLALEIAQLVA